MNANEVIESYVTEVAVQLPRRQRNDVAFELRSLIQEGLQDQADASGRVIDEAMAIEFLRAFGRPTEVAARYRPVLHIIDPADSRRFLRAAVIGLAVLWFVGVLEFVQQPHESMEALLGALGQRWVGTVAASFWWLGLLVAGFGAASWARRRQPQASRWKPAGPRPSGGRAGLVLGIVGTLCGAFVLANPKWLLDVVFGGRAAPAAYEALTYTETFLRLQAPILFGLILLNVPLWIAVIVKGQWSALLRRVETGLSLLTCAAMTWTIFGGPVFHTPTSDRTVKSFLALITLATLVALIVKGYRSVRPRPTLQPQV